jgi:hypothetical protein
MRAWVVLGLVLAGCGSETSLSKADDEVVLPAPIMRVTPAELSFGIGRAGEDVVRTFEIANEGDDVLDVTSVFVESSAYTIVEPLFPLTLAPGEGVSVDVAFDAGGGLMEGLATVSGSDPITPEAGVRLVGELGVARLEIDPLAVDFGDVPLLCEEQTSVLLTSVGTVPVTVERVLVSGEGYSLVEPPMLPLVLDPGVSTTVDVAVLPMLEGPSDGVLVVASDDPAGDAIAALSSLASSDGDCTPPGEAELVFDVQYERADIAIILDTSSSMTAALAALTSQFASIASSVASTVPDTTWGVGSFDDYQFMGQPNDRPFRLEQQQTDDLARVGATLGSITLAVGGIDWEEAGAEALVQAAGGGGYDQDCSRSFDVSTDVRPFIASPLDAFSGVAAGTYDATVPGTGRNGGMGFRDRVFPIFILATDAAMKEEGPQTPGGCPSDATVLDAIYEISELGGSFIGVEVVGWGESPAPQMETIATATSSFGDLDGDGITEPTVVRWSDSDVVFRDTVVRAIEALVADAVFDKVVLEVASDPDAVVLGISPTEYRSLVAGTEISFDLTLDGEMFLTPQPGASEVRFELVADDTVLLAERTIWVD